MSSYSFEACNLNVGGFNISGYGEAGGISFDWEEDSVIPTTGADGEVTYSRSANANVVATITVMNSKKGYRDLASLQKAQDAQFKLGIPLNLMTFSFVDPMIGDTITSPKARFLNRPNVAKGKTIGEVEFKIHIANPLRTNGSLILG